MTKNSRYFLVGGVLSIGYLSMPFIFGRGPDVWTLVATGDLNQLGDFLAGFFAPVAFLWLIIGYLMQSKELSLQRQELAATVNALKLQADALEVQAREQATSSEALQSQAQTLMRQEEQAFKKTAPSFSIETVSVSSGGLNGNRWNCLLHNLGETVEAVSLVIALNGIEITSKKWPSILQGKSAKFDFTTQHERLSIAIHSRSSIGETGSQFWDVNNREFRLKGTEYPT